MRLTDRLIYCGKVEAKVRSVGIPFWMDRVRVSVNRQQKRIEARARVEWVASQMDAKGWKLVEAAFHNVQAWKMTGRATIDGQIVTTIPTEIVMLFDIQENAG